MSGSPLLSRLAAEPESAALTLDVDGTLAPIADRPEDAAVPPETRAELARLNGRYALVACLSGRPASDAARVVGVEGLLDAGSSSSRRPRSEPSGSPPSRRPWTGPRRRASG